MKKRILGSLLAALFLVGLMAPSALAFVNGVAVFSGPAQVGSQFNGGCPKSGAASVGGAGLGVDPTTQQNYGYHFGTGFTFAGTNNALQPDVYFGNLNVCGFLTAPLNLKPPLGASCISTKGHHGRGRATGTGLLNPANTIDLKIFNINWKAAVGGVLVITGNYEVYDASGEKKDKRLGNIFAVANASPSATGDPTACLTNAQTAFDVNGIAALYQLGVPVPKGGELGPKKCPTGTQSGECQGGNLKP